MNGDERSRAVQHDTAACYRFVKATAAACKLNGGFPSYPDATRRLLTHLSKLSVFTQDFLLTFPSKNPDDPAEHRRRRQLLLTIREAWQSLHFYIQPAVDADTLSVPTELIRLLTERVRLIDGCEVLEFAAIHTDKLNYFQFPPGDFEEAVRGLGGAISAQIEFPPNLGLIALPHSQSQHLFLNGLLAHEIGHFVFSKLRCLDRLENVISEGLSNEFSPLSNIGLDPKLRGKLPGILQDWAEELFCDLFGVYLLGPSFALASVELFDLGNLLATDGTIDSTASKSHVKFQWSHPARLFRLWRQTELLDTLGWWNEISDNRSHHIQIMQECRKLRPSSFSFDSVNEPIGKQIISAFCRVFESVEAEVSRVTGNLRNNGGSDKAVDEFSRLKRTISLYLGHATVPSTLFVDKNFTYPSPVVLLNAAHLFYLGGVEDLICKSDKPDSSDIAQRSIWMERIENWTTKGLEDITMLPESGV